MKRFLLPIALFALLMFAGASCVASPSTPPPTPAPSDDGSAGFNLRNDVQSNWPTGGNPTPTPSDFSNY